MNDLTRSLGEALKDLQWAFTFEPSCQKGVIDNCRCLKCANERADFALKEYNSIIIVEQEEKKLICPNCKHPWSYHIPYGEYPNGCSVVVEQDGEKCHCSAEADFGYNLKYP